ILGANHDGRRPRAWPCDVRSETVGVDSCGRTASPRRDDGTSIARPRCALPRLDRRSAARAALRRRDARVAGNTHALSVPSALAGYLVSRIAISVGLIAMFQSVPSAYRDYLRPIPLSPDMRVIAFLFAAAVVAA